MPTSSESVRYRSTERIIIRVRLREPRSCPTRPAEWNVEPLVSSERSHRTTSLQPSLVSQYRIAVPPTPPPMTTARAELFMRGRALATRRGQRGLDQVGVREPALHAHLRTVPAEQVAGELQGRTVRVEGGPLHQ